MAMLDFTVVLSNPMLTGQFAVLRRKQVTNSTRQDRPAPSCTR